MKTSARFPRLPACCCLAVLGWAGLAACAHADDPNPKPFPKGRFDKLALHSPFSPPTPVAAVASAPAAPVAGVFDKYTVTSLMQQGTQYVATLTNKDNSEHSRVRSNEDNAEGLRLESVEWGAQVAQTRVTLRKGADSGVVRFDPAGAGAPAALNPNPGAIRPPMPGRPATPMPNFRPPPGVAPGQGAGAGAVVQSAGTVIRRDAIIRSPGVQPPGLLPGQPGVNFTNSPRPTPPPIPGAAPNTNPPLSPDADDDDN